MHLIALKRRGISGLFSGLGSWGLAPAFSPRAASPPMLPSSPEQSTFAESEAALRRGDWNADSCNTQVCGDFTRCRIGSAHRRGTEQSLGAIYLGDGGGAVPFVGEAVKEN